MAKTQFEKQFVQLAGEFGVVSELCRRQVQASLTYGNSKSADIFVISKSGDCAAKVEVKSSTINSWIVGKQAENAASHIVWVFVYFPPASNTFSQAQIAENGQSSPHYYVLTSHEVNTIYANKIVEAKKAAPKKKKKKEEAIPSFPGEGGTDPVTFEADATAEAQLPPIVTFQKSDLQNHYGSWNKVSKALRINKRSAV